MLYIVCVVSFVNDVEDWLGMVNCELLSYILHFTLPFEFSAYFTKLNTYRIFNIQ